MSLVIPSAASGHSPIGYYHFPNIYSAPFVDISTNGHLNEVYHNDIWPKGNCTFPVKQSGHRLHWYIYMDLNLKLFIILIFCFFFFNRDYIIKINFKINNFKMFLQKYENLFL